MTGVVTATITDIQLSQVMDAEYELLSMDIIHEINKIPTAQLVFLDGEAAQQKFRISNSDFFKPGQQIEIKLRYEGESDTVVFVGLVVKQTIRANQTKSILTVYLKDATIHLTQQRRNAIFREQDDIQIIKAILQPYADAQKIAIGTFTPEETAMTHPEMVQYYCTDWDFLLSRAEANGLWVLVKGGELSIRAPQSLDGESTPIVYGLDDIYDLEVEADIREQFGEIDAFGSVWDDANKLNNSQSAAAYDLKQAALKATDLGATISAEKCQLISGVPLADPEAETWASAKLLKHRLSLLKGRILVAGRGDLYPGAWLKLEKFSNYFNGETLVTGIRHQVNESGWQTDIQFGASAQFFTAAHAADLAAPPASGLLPAVHGLQVGVVGEAKDDPTGMYRVPVHLPRLTPTLENATDKNDGLVWARLATLEAGLAEDPEKGRGTLFRPEKGDEVVLGFLNDDPRQAIILGSLYSDKNKSPAPVKPENLMRGLFSKGELKLYFDDEDKSIHIQTPNENQIILVDKDGAILIQDENQNKLIMNADGIALTSEKDITITAKGKITLEGQEIDVK
ncbi:MAG: type VI secretion system tip protein VgrG [Spirulina sp. SIO3F2]|nr:type VI secretion system tip protein VgrG [Spirulina sp. SIO3F2]